MRTKILMAAVLIAGLSIRSNFAEASLISIQDLINHPEMFSQDQSVQIECYFSRESGVWLHLVNDPSQYIGFFVFEKKASFLFPEKESFPYVFAPRSLKNEIRKLRKGDEIVILGKCFKHKAVGKEAVGILIDQIRIPGEETSIQAVATEEGEAWSGTFKVPKRARSPSAGALATSSSESSVGTYSIQMGDNSVSGLHWGEKYTINGVEVVVTKDEEVSRAED